jgi:hypothetical protein
MKKSNVGVSSSGKTFVPSFVKIGQMLQTLKCARAHTKRMHGDFVIPFLSLRRKNRPTSIKQFMFFEFVEEEDLHLTYEIIRAI